jgi:hypothetical protein
MTDEGRLPSGMNNPVTLLTDEVPASESAEKSHAGSRAPPSALDPDHLIHNFWG